MFRHVIVLAKRTAFVSASFISAAKSNAVPLFCVSGWRIFAGCSGSEITSNFQVSRVRPVFTFCSSDNECGSGFPRETSRNLS